MGHSFPDGCYDFRMGEVGVEDAGITLAWVYSSGVSRDFSFRCSECSGLNTCHNAPQLLKLLRVIFLVSVDVRLSDCRFFTLAIACSLPQFTLKFAVTVDWDSE